MKNAVFWDVTLCSSGKNDVSKEPITSITIVKKNHFSWVLQLQGRRTRQCAISQSWYIATRLHGDTLQKTSQPFHNAVNISEISQSSLEKSLTQSRHLRVSLLGLWPMMFHCSSVGIVTDYGLDDREVGFRVPTGSRIFVSPYGPYRI
jgi:hypothetical protein